MMWPMCICIVVADCALGYRIPIYTPAAADKKEGEQSRLLTAVVEYLSKERLSYSPIGKHIYLSSFEPLMKVPRFSQVGTNSKRYVKKKY